MKRRSFPKFPSPAAASAATDRIAEGDGVSRKGASEGFAVAAQKSRYSRELLIMGAQLDLKISGRDTNGALCVYDVSRLSKGGPALHRHQDQDEWFYVIRGEFIVRVGDDTFKLYSGDSAFAPRKIPHAYAMTSEGEGQLSAVLRFWEACRHRKILLTGSQPIDKLLGNRAVQHTLKDGGGRSMAYVDLGELGYVTLSEGELVTLWNTAFGNIGLGLSDQEFSVYQWYRAAPWLDTDNSPGVAIVIGDSGTCGGRSGESLVMHDNSFVYLYLTVKNTGKGTAAVGFQWLSAPQISE